jgi:hypothetical protein
LLLRVVFFDAVSFLDTPDELVALAGDPIHFVVGKLAPYVSRFMSSRIKCLS